jgi:hypothetical protein
LVADHDPHHWAQTIRAVLVEKECTLARTEAAYAFAGGNGVAAMSKAYLSEYEQILSQPNQARQSAAVPHFR